MEYIIIAVMAFAASVLTFFSGFGLGTLLLPVFSIFFPIPMAIAMTAIVHLLNNIFKIGLIGKHIDWGVVLRFGLPAFFASFLGAYLLVNITRVHSLMTYQIWEKIYSIELVNLIIGLLLLCFATLEISKNQIFQFKKPHLVWGGLLSGFLGGLSGFQGAFRSLFLINCNLSKEAFIASGVAIACFVDFARISTYSFSLDVFKNHIDILITATLFAFLGAYIGNHFLKVATIQSLKIFIALFVYIIGIAMIMGFL